MSFGHTIGRLEAAPLQLLAGSSALLRRITTTRARYLRSGARGGSSMAGDATAIQSADGAGATRSLGFAPDVDSSCEREREIGSSIRDLVLIGISPARVMRAADLRRISPATRAIRVELESGSGFGLRERNVKTRGGEKTKPRHTLLKNQPKSEAKANNEGELVEFAR